MEREGVEDTVRVLRAIRSLAHNRRLQPLVQERIERAEATIRSQLLLNETTQLRIGPYDVCLDESGEIQLSKLSVDGWRQERMSLQDENLDP